MRLNWILWFSVVSVYKECLRAPWNRPGIPARHWALSRGSGRRRPRACVRRATHASLRHHRRPSIARSLHYDAPPSPSDLAMDSTATVIAEARERPPPLYAAGDSARITRWRHGSHADAISMPVRIHPISIHNKTHIIQRLYANTDYSKSPSTYWNEWWLWPCWILYLTAKQLWDLKAKHLQMWPSHICYLHYLLFPCNISDP